MDFCIELNQSSIAIIGLTLDLIGVIFIYIYGIAPKELPTHKQQLMAEEEVPDFEVVIQKNRKIKIMSRLGLTMVISGFFIQILSYVL